MVNFPRIMIRIDFSQEEIELLDWERKHHPHPRVRQKMEVLYFKAMGLPHGQIERLCQIARATLVRYLRQYQEGGVGELRKLRFHQPESAMMEYRQELEKSFSDNPPSTVNEARERIERETQLKRSPAAVNRFLKNLGMERRKVGSIPAKADPGQQEAFVEQKLNPRLAEMESGKREQFCRRRAFRVGTVPRLSMVMGPLVCARRHGAETV
jgi:transposase